MVCEVKFMVSALQVSVANNVIGVKHKTVNIENSRVIFFIGIFTGNNMFNLTRGIFNKHTILTGEYSLKRTRSEVKFI